MNLLKLTKKDGKPCYINPNSVQYFDECGNAPEDLPELRMTKIFMIGGNVTVRESPEEVENKLRWIGTVRI